MSLASISCSRRAWLQGLGLAAASLSPFRALGQDLAYFRIAAGLPGTPIYDLTGLISGAISNPPGARPCEEGGSCGVPGLIALAQTSTGSFDSLRQLQADLVEAAIVQADSAYLAFRGLAQYQGKAANPHLRAIAGLGGMTVKIVVPAASSIRQIADLAGKRIGIGLRGSDNSISARFLLATYGLSGKQAQLLFVDIPAAIDAFIAGDLDALVVIDPQNSQDVGELAARSIIRILPIAGDARRDLLHRYNFLTPVTVKAGAYVGVPETDTIGMIALWVVEEKADPDLIFALTQAIWRENTRKLQNLASAGGQALDLNLSLAGVSLPFHEGALRYYQERGALPDLNPT